MKREETVEEVEKNTELERRTPKPGAARSNRAGCTNLEEKSPDLEAKRISQRTPKMWGFLFFYGDFSCIIV